MDYKHYFIIFMIFCVFLPMNAFADPSIDISLDLPIYTKSDIITIFGNIEHDDSLNLMIIDPKADIILNETVLLTQGEFTYNLQLSDYDLNTSGIYQISVTYHDTNNFTEIEIKKDHISLEAEIQKTLSFQILEILEIFVSALCLMFF